MDTDSTNDLLTVFALGNNAFARVSTSEPTNGIGIRLLYALSEMGWKTVRGVEGLM